MEKVKKLNDNDNFEIIEDLEDDIDDELNPDQIVEFDFSKTEEIYFDENNIIVDDENKAVKRVTRYYDKNGNLVQELFAYRDDEKNNVDIEVEFTDEEGNIVDEDVAYYAVYKKIADGKVINEEKVVIYRR